MKMPWLAALLNFFFMGLGYIYNGRRALLGIGWTIAALVLTYVEQVRLKPIDSEGFAVMAVGVLIANTCFAIDGWREAKAINAARDVSSGKPVAKAA